MSLEIDNALRPRDAHRLIVRAMRVSRPVFLWGPPGIGKSELIETIGNDWNRPANLMPEDDNPNARLVIDMRLLLMDPTDIKGMPFYNPDTKEMEWAKPGELPAVVDASTLKAEQAKLDSMNEKHAKLQKAFEGRGYDSVEMTSENLATLSKYEELNDKLEEQIRMQTAFVFRTEHALKFQDAILFLDEMNAAPPSVMAAGYQLILNRRVGAYILPKGVSILAAGNRDNDKGVTFRMPSPLANRFTHLELESNFEDWQKWAVNNDVHPDVVGFLSHHTQKLFTFNPKSPDKAFATPRSWVFVSDLIDDDAIETDNTKLVAGTVGRGLAIEFNAHRKFASRLPKPGEVLTGTVTDLKVKEISAMYSLTISLCYTLQEWLKRSNDPDEAKYGKDEWHENVDNFFGYLMDNFETEMIVLGAKTALRDYKLPIDHRKLKNFKQFHKEYGTYILDD